MYATLTFFVLSMIYMNLKIFERKNTAKFTDFLILGLITLLGTLTQYYFILFEGLTGLIMLVFQIKERNIKDLIKYIITAVLGSAAALCIYPYIITNVLGGNRGFGSLSISIDPITVVTYFAYKIGTYIQVLAKDVFLNQIWLLALCSVALIGFGFTCALSERKSFLAQRIWLLFRHLFILLQFRLFLRLTATATLWRLYRCL